MQATTHTAPKHEGRQGEKELTFTQSHVLQTLTFYLNPDKRQNLKIIFEMADSFCHTPEMSHSTNNLFTAPSHTENWNKLPQLSRLAQIINVSTTCASHHSRSLQLIFLFAPPVVFANKRLLVVLGSSMLLSSAFAQTFQGFSPSC